jgi:ZIP family zinc transporter
LTDIDLSSANILLALAVTVGAGMATVLGSVLLFFSRAPSPRLLAFGLAFSAGAMVYVSLSEILNKSIASFAGLHGPDHGFVFATLAFLAGIFLIALIDHMVPNPHECLDVESDLYQSGNSEYIRRVALMSALAITAHNFPEGMATFFSMLESPTIGLPLAFAIAIHNIPEGISIAIPVYFLTNSRKFAICAALLSGLAEPVGAILGYWILSPFLSSDVFGAVFGVIAGVMVYLALDELLPAAKKYAKGHETVYGLISGMTALAVSLILFRL